MRTTVMVLAAALPILPAAANAQQLPNDRVQLGVRGGVSIDPAFAFGGLRIESSWQKRLTCRFTFDIGRGKKPGSFYGLAGIFRLRKDPWTQGRSWSPYVGFGPALMYSRINSDYLADGYGIIVGAEHRNGLSFEVEYNVWNVPRLYFVFGYRLR